MTRIDAEIVLALARAQGHAWVDAAAAERIAAGASAALDAVQATTRSAEPALLTTDPAVFLATLEALAGPGR